MTISTSHSSLAAFNKCKRYYKLRHIDLIFPKVKKSSLRFGTIFHKSVELMYKTGVIDPSLSYIEKETETVDTTTVYATGQGWSKPWGATDKDKDSSKKETGDGGGAASSSASAPGVEDTGMLTDRYDAPTASNQNQINPGLVMQAYISALLEIYTDDLLELLDFLNKFPGAPIIAKLIASFDCPAPALFNPSIMDFINDIEIPWCSGVWDITAPLLINPFGWLSDLKDIMKFLWWMLMIQLTRLISKILWKLLLKICELISSDGWRASGIFTCCSSRKNNICRCY